MIVTDDKIHIQKINRSSVEIFLEDCVHYVPGSVILYSDFYAKFLEQLDAQEKSFWSIIKFGKNLPPQFPKGRMSYDPQYHIGNASFNKDIPPTIKLVLVGDKLIPETQNGQGNNIEERRSSDISR